MGTLKQGFGGKSKEFWERLKDKFPFQRKLPPPERPQIERMGKSTLKQILLALKTPTAIESVSDPQQRKSFIDGVNNAILKSFSGISNDFDKLHPDDVVEIISTALFSTSPDVRKKAMELLLKEPKDFTDHGDKRACNSIHTLPRKSLVNIVSIVFDTLFTILTVGRFTSTELDNLLKIIDFTDIYLGGISKSYGLQLKATPIIEMAATRGLLSNYDYIRAVVAEKKEEILETSINSPNSIPVARSIVKAIRYCEPEAVLRLTDIVLRKCDDPVLLKTAIENLISLEANQNPILALAALTEKNTADPKSSGIVQQRIHKIEWLIFEVAKKCLSVDTTDKRTIGVSNDELAAFQMIQFMKPGHVVEIVTSIIHSKNTNAAIFAFEMMPSVKKFDEIPPAILVGLVDMAVSSKHAGIIWPAASMLSRLPKEHQTAKRWNTVAERMENELGCRYEPGRILKLAELFNSIPKKYITKHMLGLVFRNVINDVQVSGAAKRHLEPETWKPYHEVLLLFTKKQVAKTLQEIIAQLKNEVVAEKFSSAMPTLKKEMKQQRNVGSDLAISLFLANCIQMLPEKFVSRNMWNDSSEVVKAVLRRRDCRKQVSEIYLLDIFPTQYHQELITALNQEKSARSGIFGMATDALKTVLAELTSRIKPTK